MDLNYNFLAELEKKYGDSYYLLYSESFKKNFDDFLEEFRKFYPKTYIGYSYKTNYTPRLCEIINEKGGYAEVVSEMEFDLAVEIKVPYHKIIVNGPYKNKKALEKFLLTGSLVNIDSYRELENILIIASENKTKDINIGIRCNFEINDDLVSRFGFDIYHENFKTIFSKIKKFNNVKLKGLHCHFPNRDIDSYKFRVDKMLSLVDEIFETTIPEFIDIGGGYFGKMNKDLAEQFSCPVPKYNEYAHIIAKKISEKFFKIEEEKKPILFLEPGSAIVADVMSFVCKVVDVKEVRGRRIAMSSGSRFNIGLLSSKINMPMSVYSSSVTSNKSNHIKTQISGYTCIESDYLYREYSGNIAIDDYLVFQNVGSYSVVFKPPFILPNVPVIEITSEGFKEIKRKETMEDVFKTFLY